MSWKTYRVINNINYINKINKVIFLQRDDTKCEYNDEIELSFATYKQDGSLDMNDGIVKVSINTKVMIEINLFYKYTNTEFAPRYELNLFKNNVKINTHYCGMNDTVVNTNNLYIVSVCDVVNDDVIKIVLNKDRTEDSTDFIDILKNSYIINKTF